jgi:hypothetical protein
MGRNADPRLSIRSIVEAMVIVALAVAWALLMLALDDIQ